MSVSSILSQQGLTCNVERRTEARDDAGSVTVTWAGHISNLQAFVQPASGSEGVRYGRESNRRFHTVYVEPGQDIIPADRLTGGDLGSRLFDIQAVRTPGELMAGKRLRHTVLDCEETD